MKDNKTYKAIKASERLPNYEDDFYTERGVIVFFPDQKAFGYYDKEYPDGPEEFIEVNIQYWLEEQEQGDVIEVPLWRFKAIEDALRLTNNIYKLHRKETAYERSAYKAYQFAKDLLSQHPS